MKVRLALPILMLLIVFSMVAPLSAQDAPVPPAVGARPDAPTYALHGPYWVGTQTIEVGAGTDEAHRFVIWYPALNPDGLEESVVYTMSESHILRFMLPETEPFTVLGHALQDAAPDLSGGPYPLVINSHGFTAQMWQVYLGEHLASYGFVVIATEHANDSWDNPYTGTAIRMLEVKRAIVDAETLTAEGGALAGMIDVERIAMSGHSSGGMTVYGAAGAPVDWTGAEEYCAAVPDDPTCTDLEKQHQEFIEVLGTTVGADGLLPVVWDDRIDAIIPMAGSTELHGELGLPAITVPMMALFGTNDPAAPWMYPAYEFVGSALKAQVLFENGGHGLFYNQCDAFDYILKYDLFWGCSDAVWDIARAQDVSNYFITAFLLDVLKGDVDAHAALSPDAVSFPGIIYKAEGF